MWIDRLDLLAFGHFTDVRLTLGPGFHLIYGPNEAGKSTTLRAIRQLLFGFDERTTDNFIHQNPNLRIGGVLRDESGRSLEVIRRKTRKDSLLGADQQTAIDPDLWNEWLCQIDESTFSNRYGIDYEQLIKGGHEIATGTGDLGEILFAAGSGILDLTAVQKSLADEAAEIFRPQGKKQRLNQAIVEWQSQREIVTKSLLPVAEWEEADQIRQNCLARLQVVTTQVQQTEAQLDSIQRWLKARPFLIELRRIEAEIAAYRSTPSLPAGFSNKKQEAILRWKQSTAAEKEESESLQKLDEELNRIVLPAGIIESAKEITELLTESGSYRKAQSDRPGLVQQLEHLQRQSQTLVGEFEKSFNQPLLKTVQIEREQRHQISVLVQKQSQLSAAMEQAEAQARELAGQIEEASRRVVPLPNDVKVDQLRTAYREARATGDLETRQQQLIQEINQADARLALNCQQLGITVEMCQKLKSMQVPSEEAIRRQDIALEKVRSEKAVLQSRLSEHESEFGGLKRQIDELRDRFQIPSEGDLEQVRAERNELLKQIRQSIEAQQVPTMANWQSFEAIIERADSISDRLRREADRVAKLVELSADLNSNETKQHDISIRLATVNASQIDLEKRWIEDWPDLNGCPSSMRELQSWLAKREIAIQLFDDLHRRETLAAELTSKIEEHRKSLMAAFDVQKPGNSNEIEDDHQQSSAMPRKQLSFGWDAEEEQSAELDAGAEASTTSLGTLTLAELLKRAEETLGSHDRLQVEHRDATQLVDSLKRQQASSQAHLKKLRSELAEWDTGWRQQLSSLQLPADFTPEALTNFVESSIELSNLAHQSNQLRGRIAGIDQDGTAFEIRAKTLFEKIAPDVVASEIEPAVKSIQLRLNTALRDQTKLEELKRRRDMAQKKRVAAGEAKTSAVQLVCELIEIAGLPRPSVSEPSGELFENWLTELSRFEERASEKSVLEQKCQQLKARLQEFAKEEPLETFLASLNADGSFEAESQINVLRQECDRLESERDQLNQQIGSAEQRLSAMNGASKAAEAQEQQVQIFAQIRSDVEQFARAKLASVILHAAIERYRDRIRGPVLKVASELFHELTLGSFDGLRVEEDDHGKPVLVGLRKDQRVSVPVDGMSEGTCDQLYLALRMASLQLEAAPRSHLPLIIDDILIQFDDVRSAAALKMLARFGQQRQMIFFTHHERLVEIARREIGNSVTTHHLSS